MIITITTRHSAPWDGGDGTNLDVRVWKRTIFIVYCVCVCAHHVCSAGCDVDICMFVTWSDPCIIMCRVLRYREWYIYCEVSWWALNGCSDSMPCTLVVSDSVLAVDLFRCSFCVRHSNTCYTKTHIYASRERHLVGELHLTKIVLFFWLINGW